MSCPIGINKCQEVPSCNYYDERDQSCSYPDKCDIVDESVLAEAKTSDNMSIIRE